MSNTTQIAERGNGALAQREAGEQSRAFLIPAVDVVEGPQGVTLLADLPGVTRDKLEISINDGTLSIEAQPSIPTPAGLRLQHAEVREPCFARSFALGAEFDSTKVEASLKDGVLKLIIPRKEEAHPRRIEVIAG